MKLIINADDFGLSKSISDGIIYGIKKGFITSTSIMANMDYAKYAVSEALKNNITSLGLHINLTLGKPIINNSNITDENGVFYYNRMQIENDKLTFDDAYMEIKAQIEKVKEYGEGKIKIDHLDCHHHLIDNENIKKAIIEIANENNLKVRKMFDSDLKSPDIFYTDFSINNVNINALETMIEKYQSTDYTVELLTHSGYIDEYTKEITSYVGRDKELQVLEEAYDEGIFNSIPLISYDEL